MGPLESGSASGRTELVDPSRVVPALPERERSRSERHVWTIVLSTAVVAGLISWLGGEAAYGLFKPRLFVVHLLDGSTSLQPSIPSLRAADVKNTALALGILGAVTALAMSFAGGLVTGSPARGVMVGLGTLAVGALVSVLATFALFPLLHRQPVPDPNDMLTPVLVQAGIWMIVGAMAGISFAIGMRRDRHLAAATVAACLAALLATVVYHLLIGGLLTDLGPTMLIPGTSGLRLIAVLTATILIAAGAARGALGDLGRSKSPTPAQELT
jgi:hypothetical protein